MPPFFRLYLKKLIKFPFFLLSKIKRDHANQQTPDYSRGAGVHIRRSSSNNRFADAKMKRKNY